MTEDYPVHNAGGIVKALEGTKHDYGKPRMELLDPAFVEGVAKVLTFGAEKYDAHNWRKGLAPGRTMGAALRHIFAWLRGERYDNETGLHHLLHAGCEIMFSYWTDENKPALDDRYKNDDN
jgi:hypothetical protein